MKAPGRPGAFLYLLRTFFRCWTGDRRLLSSCCLSGDRGFSTGRDRHGLPVTAGLKDSFLSCAVARPRPVSASNGPVSFFVRLQVLRVVPSLFPAHLCEQSALGRGSLRGDPSRASRGVPPQKSAVPVSDAGASRASTAEMRRFPPPMTNNQPASPGRAARQTAAATASAARAPSSSSFQGPWPSGRGCLAARAKTISPSKSMWAGMM